MIFFGGCMLLLKSTNRLVLLLALSLTRLLFKLNAETKSEPLKASSGLSLEQWLEVTLQFEETVAFQSQNVSTEALNYLKSRLFGKRLFLWIRILWPVLSKTLYRNVLLELAEANGVNSVDP